MTFKHATSLFAFSVALLGASLPAAAGNAEAGKAKASACSTCHIPGSPTNPYLHGQPEEYLIVATKAYKTGERNHGMMNALVANLSDEDIADISAYYASQPCQ